MKFKEALEYYEQGKKIRRKCWHFGIFISKDWKEGNMEFSGLDSDDWMVILEPKPKKKIKLYAYVSKDVLGVPGRHSIHCSIHYSTEQRFQQYLHLPNLDQEVEVDE